LKLQVACSESISGAARPPRRFWRSGGRSWLLLAVLCATSSYGNSAAADSTATAPKTNRFIFWTEVAPLQSVQRAVDVAFASPGLNIVQPVDVAWVLDGAAQDVVGIAAKPIQDTAEAGEALGRFGAGILRAPIALAATESSRFVLEASGRLIVRRPTHAPPPALATRFDSLTLALGRDRAVDLAVSSLGLIYVLAGNTIRVFADPPTGPPLWTFAVDAALRPAQALVVSMRGEVFVAGGGRDAIAVYDLDPTGKYRRVRGASALDLGVGGLTGIALSPMLLLPIDTREGWAGEDRFVIVSDPAGGRLLALEASNLTRLATFDVRAKQPDAVPGRLDVSNRGQIAYVDTKSGAATSLPAPVFAALIAPAKIRWREVIPDSSVRVLGGDSR